MKRIINILKKWANVFPSVSKVFSMLAIAAISFSDYVGYLLRGTDS